MIALTRLPARTFSTLLILELAIAAVTGVALLSVRRPMLVESLAN